MTDKTTIDKYQQSLDKALEGALSCGFNGPNLHVTYENGDEKWFFYKDGEWK